MTCHMCHPDRQQWYLKPSNRRMHITHQSSMTISGWNSSSSSSHRPSAFRSTTCSVENQLWTKQEATSEHKTLALLEMCVYKYVCYTCQVSETPTCILAVDTPQHLWEWDWNHKGGHHCWWSSHWSHLWGSSVDIWSQICFCFENMSKHS